MFSIESGDQLMVLGDETQGIALLKSESFLEMAEMIQKNIQR